MAAGISQWRRGEDEFEQQVNGPSYNKLPIDRAPDLVVAPRSEGELIEAVRAARQNGQRIAVRSGGHSWIAASVREGGMLIDMAAFDRLEIDAESKIARIGPAIRSERFGKALADVNLAFPIGHCGGPAMGGYLLAGGLGLNFGTWHPACFSIRSIRVVTANGELLVADDSSNSELLWMARGAGPGFPGIVTEFELELKDRPADVRLSSWYFPLEAADEVTRWVAEASSRLPLNVEVATALIGPARTTLQPAEGHPSHLIGVSAVAFVDSEAQAIRALSALSDGPGVPALLKTELTAIPFEQLYLGADASLPPGQRVLADSFWTDRDVRTLLPPLSDTIKGAPSGKSFALAIMPGHGAPGLRMPTDKGAYSMDQRTWVLAFAVWEDAREDAANRVWMNGLIEQLEPISTGCFVGEADLTRHDQRATRSFSSANWARLTELRAHWDPDGVFHGFPQVEINTR